MGNQHYLRGPANKGYSQALLKTSESHSHKVHQKIRSRQMKNMRFFSQESLKDEPPVTLGACVSDLVSKGDAGFCVKLEKIELDVHGSTPASITIDSTCMPDCSGQAGACDDLVTKAIEAGFGSDGFPMNYNKTDCEYIDCLGLSNSDDPFSRLKLNLLCAALQKEHLLYTKPRKDDLRTFGIGVGSMVLLCLFLWMCRKKIDKCRDRIDRCRDRFEPSLPAERAILMRHIDEDEEKIYPVSAGLIVDEIDIAELAAGRRPPLY